MTGGGLRGLPTPTAPRSGRCRSGRDWIWITGNHDPEPAENIGGRFLDVLKVGALTFRHEPGGKDEGEIAGHLHPVARVARRGRAVSRRCFACDGVRLVMPAFGAYTGGLNVRDRAFANVFPTLGFTAHMLGDRAGLSGCGQALPAGLRDLISPHRIVQHWVPAFAGTNVVGSAALSPVRPRGSGDPGIQKPKPQLSDQSRRNTTEANQPVNTAISAAVRP